MTTNRRTTEAEFRQIIRDMVASGTYPRHRDIVIRLGRSFERWASGLSQDQVRWRQQEVEAAGYDWDASRSARRLVKKGSRAGGRPAW